VPCPRKGNASGRVVSPAWEGAIMSRRPRVWMLIQAWVFPLTRRILQGTQTTRVRKLTSRISVPLLSGKNFHITYLPVNEWIEGADGTIVPEVVLEEIVRSSSHRVIIRRCTCRDGNQCSNHPIGLSCLLLGEGTREIDPAVGRHVGVEEALRHIRRCIDSGLIPFVGRFRADNLLWGVKDRGRLLTVCFCCPCCCIIMNAMRYMPRTSQERVVRLKGLTIRIDAGQCNLCGECVRSCFMGALLESDGQLIRDDSICKGCGLCITACPSGAVSAAVADLPAAVADLKGRIEALLDYR